MMKMKFTWWHVFCVFLELVAIVMLALCIMTDINDDLFLPITLLCTLIANVTLLVMHTRQGRRRGSAGAQADVRREA